jgi:hypothetical protein
MNQAKGRRYHGQMEIKYKLADIDTMDVRTAPQALKGFISNTYVAEIPVSHGLGTKRTETLAMSTAYLWGHGLDNVCKADTIWQLGTNLLESPFLCELGPLHV